MSGRLNVHILWNLVSVAVLAASGLAANILIGRLDGPLVLGVFTQVTSLYFVVSQLSLLGVNFSVLKHVTEFRNDPQVAASAASTGVGLTIVCSLVFSLAAFASAPLVEQVLGSRLVAEAWTLVIPTLIAFNLNKVLLAILNAHERMIAFAVFMGCRFLLVLAIFAVFVSRDAPIPWVGAMVGFAETLVCLFLLPFTYRYWAAPWRTWSSTWARTHLRFGIRGYLTALTLELNSKITVLVAGVFLHDASVGVYSMTTMFLDGLMQFAAAVRNNFNPLITRCMTEGKISDLEELAKKAKRHVLTGSLVLGGFCLAVFPVFVRVVLADQEFSAGLVPLGLLISGMVVCAPRFPFTMIFIQSGRPGLQTFYNGAVTLLNVGFNAALTPLLGISGAALGTALALGAAAGMLGILAKRTLGVRV